MLAKKRRRIILKVEYLKALVQYAVLNIIIMVTTTTSHS